MKGTLPRQSSGFALGLVVLMLFAIAVAGIAGFQVVSNEFVLSAHNRDGLKALAVARAGLQRYLGEAIGVLGDSVSYAIGDGIATVTTRRVLVKNALDHLYYVRSEGTIADNRTPDSPARRIVATYAWKKIEPVRPKGAFMLMGGDLRVYSPASVHGADSATPLECFGGGSAHTAGLLTAGTSSPSPNPQVSGSPAVVTYPSFSAAYDTVGLRWDILQNPSFPVEFDGSPPATGLPVDSFPVVRYQGNLTATSAWSGQGVLIVTGRLTLGTGFSWNGIILAGQLGDVPSGANPAPIISGLLVAGLDGGTIASPRFDRGTYRYHSCNVRKANHALSYLEVVRDVDFEVSG